MSDIIERAVKLPWPLFLRVLGNAEIPDGSFSPVQTIDERRLTLDLVVKSLDVSAGEIERALDALRPGSSRASINHSGGGVVTNLVPSGSGSLRVKHDGPAKIDPWSDECYKGGAKILHLSDLHLNDQSDVKVLASRLDVALRTYTPTLSPDYIVVSGDFTDRGGLVGFEKAVEFLEDISRRMKVQRDHFILVPGNHDVIDDINAYSRCTRTPSEKELSSRSFIELKSTGGGSVFFEKNLIEYRKRFESFSRELHQSFLRCPYPLDETAQAHVHTFAEHSLQFLTFNSAWEIDEFNRRRSGINPIALCNLRDQVARESTVERGSDQGILRIAVCHHPVLGPGQMQSTPFMDTFQEMNVKIVMHGDVHELNRCDYLGFRPHRRVHVVGSGAFDAKKEDRPESTPRLLNFLEISRDHRFLRVHTLNRAGPDSEWKPMTNWIPPGARGTTGLSYFVVDLDRGYD